jgi:beta-mannosidase
MFACGVYRADEQFIENVHVESVAAMRRLRHHPSLVLWCGNNEMEWFWDVRWKGRIPGTAREAYNTLFHNLLPQWVEEEDPATPYWPSSPSSGEPFVDPNGESRGDGHYWEVWHGRKPFTDYRNRYFRFMSEFGFQALPPIETIATFAPRGEQNMTSYVMECHQKNAAGNGLIVYYLTNNFRLPKSFEALCDVTQILQAEAMRYGVEHWRRNRRLCSGTLYWQLNDCWPVASWASIDYFGRWKALHYAARRFYAPVHLSAEEERHQVGMHVTNDLRKPFRGTVVWSLQTLGGLKLSEGRENVEAAAEANTPVARLDFSEFLDGDLSREAWLVFELRDATGARQALEAVPFAPFKHLKLENPRLTAQLNSAHQRCRITISAQRAAAFVHVRLRGIDTVFSDNFFHLPAGGECVVTCAKPSGHKMEDLRYRLRVTSLWDTF